MSVKKFTMTALAVLTGLSGIAAAKEQGLSAEFISAHEVPTQADELDIELLSETLGYYLGAGLEGPGFKFDLNAIIRGLRAGVDGEEPKMDQEEFQAKMQQLQMRAYEATAAENLREAEEFLVENGKHESIVQLEENKLQYRLLKEGTGPVVEEGNQPLLHYVGRYQDGTLLDSSVERGEPVAMQLDHVIPGFARAIVGMREGEKRIVYIHPDLGYGASAPGSVIPNSLLVFEIEILKADTREVTE